MYKNTYFRDPTCSPMGWQDAFSSVLLSQFSWIYFASSCDSWLEDLKEENYWEESQAVRPLT